MPTRLGRRDVPMMDTKLFAVHFDSYHNHRTAYRFAINPSNTVWAYTPRTEVQGQGRFDH